MPSSALWKKHDLFVFRESENQRTFFKGFADERIEKNEKVEKELERDFWVKINKKFEREWEREMEQEWDEGTEREKE